MQKYAITPEGKLIFIANARKKETYYCPSCRAPMRIRKGLFRAPHYYHITKACALSTATSPQHRHVQKRILSAFGEENAFLEKRFSTIQRTADVAIPSQQLIFEVQCSPISKKEVQQRTLEYGLLGFKVVWILHDQTFNRTFLSSAEQYLLSRPHYYTNIDQEGKGIIYDQFALHHRNKILRKSRPLPIMLNIFTKELAVPLIGGELGHQLLKRKKHWSFACKGDLYHQVGKEELQQMNRARTLQIRIEPLQKHLLSFLKFLNAKRKKHFPSLAEEVALRKTKKSCPRQLKKRRKRSKFLRRFP